MSVREPRTSSASDSCLRGKFVEQLFCDVLELVPHGRAGDPRQRARIDAALDWMHGNVRQGEAKLILTRVFNPRNGRDGPGNKVLGKSAEITLRQALKVRLLKLSILRSNVYDVV